MEGNVKWVSGSCNWKADTGASGGGGLQKTDKGNREVLIGWEPAPQNKDTLNQEKPGRRALFTGMFLFVKPRETFSKQHFFHFFFFFWLYNDSPTPPQSFEPRQHLAAQWCCPDSDWRSDRKTEGKKQNTTRRNGWDGATFPHGSPSETMFYVTKRQSVLSRKWRLLDDMQELNAPVGISAVAIRLMNHANLLEALRWGCRQEAVNKGQIQTLTSVQF